ncbi:hypothetical protein K227x_62270 [Rubripirellula lacrimiformis]|uniref:Uncharacterized protein n=1 Tax=Rubripirellula lacrimiformis TaxID=1930273 RepID=A0A517NL46_9BACT|nr:hypothetical protein [Rubripirellula lacrimiformis]QDT07799.1 hypothetical protein K227x_62270 [Rubripirellula lacrimiformis]
MTTATRPARPEVQPREDAFRGARATVDASAVQCDREGGRFGAGIIHGVSMIAMGEALGHEYWIDAETLAQVHSLAMAANEAGTKARFTHPGMSSDGMGRLLGRLHDPRIEGGRVLADLHLAKLAHDTPDGDLAEYVMSLADEDPTAAGLSIVFHHDFAAENEFRENHQEEFEITDHKGRKAMGTRFKSPDESNIENYPHVRLKSLNAADIVDEPAANAEGLFDRQSLARDADAFLSFALGLTDVKPQASALGVDPDRAQQFLERFMHTHSLSINKAGAEMADSPNPDPVTVDAPSREDFAAELNRFTERFGAANGAKWFGENKSFSEALELHCDAVQAELTAANEARTVAEEKLASLSLGETDPVETGADDGKESKKRTFAEAIRTKKS